MFELPKASKYKLATVHPDLQKVIYRAVELINSDKEEDYFVVTCGIRTLAEQKIYYAQGKSKTMKSRHLEGLAVDLAVWHDRDEDKVVDNGEIDWKFELYTELSKIVKQAAKDVGIPIEWGGDWTSLRDGPHFQLPHSSYPAKK